MKKFLLILTFLSSLTLYAQEEINIIPKPQIIKVLEGKRFTITPKTRLIFLSKQSELKGLAERLGKQLSIPVEATSKAGKNSIFIKTGGFAG